MKTLRKESKALLVASVAILGVLLASPVLASEGGGESNIFAGDFGNVLWTLVVFGLVVFVLGKFAWGPLLGVLEEREKLIRSSLEQARDDRKAAEARLKEYEQRLVDARSEATALVEEGRRDAEVLRARVEKEAREEADKTVERARREIELAREAAIRELFDVTGALATNIAGKVVGRELKAEDHKRLIEEAIGEIGRLETN